MLISVAGSLPLMAQQKKKSKPENRNTSEPAAKKYPSLLWEITGNGMTRPSYLFGTMHVSDKLVFHLGDSFYTAIKSADVVALETNPETWQDDYSKSVFFKNAGMGMDPYRMMEDFPQSELSINSFAIESYADILKAGLAVEPSMINGMLYRTYGTKIDDFEEDTFLDMYLFQVGKKLGKRVTGVENFQESEKLVMEAYRDMIRDQNKKRRSYDFEGMMNNPKKIEDAYRNGDLDMLDSLEALTVFSDAFQEKFLYKRNLIQANSIDSIIRKSSLFVGVGAAHLPGRKGVIEILRSKGYRLRPVIMDERNSGQKEAIDKMHLAFEFKQQSSGDGFYKVSIPGEKFYRFTNWSGMDIVQYADMVNGTYYMVNRIKTNSLFFGDNADAVQKKVDSLLYENIPGKILKKTNITRNGYKGLDIMNRTRRGDYQRYNIFITPFEILIFKMSGNGEYVNVAEDAQHFFNSIRLQESQQVSWQNWQPSTGGFQVRVPHQPMLYRDKDFGTDRFEFIAADREKGNTYLIMKTTAHNVYFEEDSFELNLLSESYSFSSFVDKETSRKFTTVNGYPALDCQYLLKDGSYTKARYVIQGPIYYVVLSKFKTDEKEAREFVESFSITPFKYPKSKQVRDTSMYFSVEAPEFKKEKDEEDASRTKMQELIRLAYRGDEDEDLYSYQDQKKFRVFGNDSIGEKVFVLLESLSEYSFVKDSNALWKKLVDDDWVSDTTHIVRQRREYTLPNGFRCRDMQMSDTGSSKLLISTSFYKDGKCFTVSTITDTLSKRSSFIETFLKTFQPADTLKGTQIFARKTKKFFNDFFGTDSVLARTARRSAYRMKFDSVDAPLVMQGIDSLSWRIKSYLEIKKHWIAQLGYIKNPLIVPYLKSIYLKVGDTSELQHTILNALLAQQTRESFVTFKDLMLQEPPIVDEESDNWTPPTIRYERITSLSDAGKYNIHYGQWGEMYDSLALTRVIFPDFLQLMTIDDYKEDVMDLLTTMVDSGYLKSGDYENYFSKIYLDAKQLLKKQVAKEEKDKIEKASRKEKSGGMFFPMIDVAGEGGGNNELQQYSILLLPFWDKNPGVPAYFNQLLKSSDHRLLYETFILLLRNKKPVPDSLFQKFAALDEYRSDLYGDLKKMNKAEKFPASFKKQELIARSLLINSGEFYGKLDTLVFVDKLPVTYKNKKGFIYFFKYKKMKDDNSWELGSVGMQPENTNEVDVDNDDFTEMERRKLEIDKPVRAQLEKALKELLIAKRSSASGFYEGRYANMYRNFLPDMVKSNRYRD